MRRLLPRVTLSLALVGSAGLLTGCGDDSNKPAAREAEQAVGINPQGQKTTTKETHNLTEITEKKVIDNTTGKVISDKTEVTPVQITKETKVNTDVNVKVGETKAMGK